MSDDAIVFLEEPESQCCCLFFLFQKEENTKAKVGVRSCLTLLSMNRKEHEAVGLDIFVISRKLVDNKVFYIILCGVIVLFIDYDEDLTRGREDTIIRVERISTP
jgi:hypothetical protein